MDRSLRGLVNIAKHEMEEEEASIRKVSNRQKPKGTDQY
jgi:hypothetical protein